MAQMINVAGVMGDSIVDGPGIRVAIFVQGAAHHCEGCHNPESWPFGAGTDMSVEDLFALVKANQLCRGVTFSGRRAVLSGRGAGAAGRKAEGSRL